ncbi:MAG: transglycosylase family protein [Acidimicrobiia bacterium]
MRNLIRRSSLLVAVFFMAITLLSSDIFSAKPAGAMTVSQRPAPIVRSSSKAKRPAAVRRVRPRNTRANRARWARASRSAVRARAVPAGDVWARLRACESGGRYNINTGNGFYGAYQFHPRTWRGLGYPGLPHQAPPEIQDEAARKLQARSGWGQWPACSRRLRLR